MAERQPEEGERHHVRHGNGRENRDLANWERHGQAEVVQLVQPFLDTPDVGIGGQVHQPLSFRLPSA
jgi:hypothetical protein